MPVRHGLTPLDCSPALADDLVYAWFLLLPILPDVAAAVADVDSKALAPVGGRWCRRRRSKSRLRPAVRGATSVVVRRAHLLGVDVYAAPTSPRRSRPASRSCFDHVPALD